MLSEFGLCVRAGERARAGRGSHVDVVSDWPPTGLPSRPSCLQDRWKKKKKKSDIIITKCVSRSRRKLRVSEAPSTRSYVR